jgi:hypothetical protein
VENLSHEHAGPACGSLASSGGRGRAPDVRADAGPRPARGQPAREVLLQATAEPPPGLWSKIEAQLRRDGVITS